MAISIRRIGWVAGMACVLALLAGCTTPGITRVSADTYRVSRADPGHVFADDEAMKAAAVADADAFAHGRGMIAVPVSFQADTLEVGHLKTLDYEFRLAAPGAPTAAATAPLVSPPLSPVVPLPASPAAATRVAPAAVPASPAVPVKAVHTDYYDELLRLDDLRKRGILTDAEFQTLKAKIIAER